MFDVVTSKWVELIHEIAPSATRLAVLSDGGAADQGQIATITGAARTLSLETLPLIASDRAMFAGAFAAARHGAAGALLVDSSPFFASEKSALIELAARYGLPAIYDNKSFPQGGALMSYGPDLAVAFRGAADYVARLLRGAKVADLPVVQPEKFELAINLKTANALGLKVPQTLLVGADEVIE
jgi:putative tryptophan/tyrosine transport system substrate-binding protein